MDSSRLRIRPLESSDYDEILVKWWEAWGWAPPKRDFLPEDGKGGLMVMDGDVPVCAGFMYVTNSNVVLLEWIISSFKFKNKKVRKEALYMLIVTVTSLAEGLGKKYVYSLLKNESLINIYKELGFNKGGNSGQEMIKKL